MTMYKITQLIEDQKNMNKIKMKLLLSYKKSDKLYSDFTLLSQNMTDIMLDNQNLRKKNFEFIISIYTTLGVLFAISAYFLSI